MFITLSEKRNEKLLIEWSGEISDRHAQDFCDVCNTVFIDHFDLDYMRRKYEENIYGKSFIIVVYRDNKPVSTMGIWRNDFDSRKGFQLVDFATLPEARKGGYALEELSAIFDELSRVYSDAVIYAFPGKMSYPIYMAIGFAERNFYTRIYHGVNEDFLNSIPFIDDAYVQQFYMHKKNAFVKHICVPGLGIKYYLMLKKKVKHIVPACVFLGEINADFKDKFSEISNMNLFLYHSLKPGILKSRKIVHATTYDPYTNEQIMNIVPPRYKEDVMTLDFNGVNIR